VSVKERALPEWPFNQRENVLALVEAGGRALGAAQWEIVFVDDDSLVDTAEVVARIVAEHPNIRCLRRIGPRRLESAADRCRIQFCPVEQP
jgi:dolichol-phosphate mannosyltransferase